MTILNIQFVVFVTESRDIIPIFIFKALIIMINLTTIEYKGIY